MAALLCGGRLGLRPGKKSVDDYARLEEIAERSKIVDRIIGILRNVSLPLPGRWPIGPTRRNERAGAVGKDDEQDEEAVAPVASKNRQCLAFKCITSTDNRRVIREIVVMGSLWMLLLMKLSTLMVFITASILWISEEGIILQ